MGFNCGIVGLPNVGKSTLFNALTETASAEAENYPFCTVEPNIGRVAVPDTRLDVVLELSPAPKSIPTYLEFVDIAGLVKGASKGEGLGNQFLGNIREVDAIIMVLRCFDDPNVSHVEATVDPVRDAETVETELLIADLESLERRIESVEKKAKGGEKEAQDTLAVMQPVLAALAEGKPARSVEVGREQRHTFKQLQMLTAKPVLFIANVDEANAAAGNAYSAKVEETAAANGAASVTIAAAIEAEIATLDDAEERAEFLRSLDLEETGLARVIRAGYALLDLITYFTTGPKESRAWTIARGGTAAAAAGQVHTDFERGFIAAEAIAYDDFAAYGGEQGAKEAGKMRLEGRDYVVHDGDVLLFRFNV
ncbi:MAG: redox-regulated ATPase YchF [Alphaproteobacteria bacterium]|jgi:hypothetical protein|nr:redox-regulated ATPase YchF [Alphaproteobacteria bacterium]MDP6603772.1 redox-regulated ATPase YchF [Rhodospirillales bacterium]